MSLMQQRIGIFGGTFDPIHYGHLAIAEEARWNLNLTSVLFVVAAHQPLKPRAPIATNQQRLDMVRLACQSNDSFTVSDKEMHRPPPSYTIDTLQAIHESYAVQSPQEQPELWFILGSDSLQSFASWHRAAEIIMLAHLAVVARPGIRVDIAPLESAIPGITHCVKSIAGPKLDISSTHIRQRMANNQPIRYQVPESVMEYIAQHQLYSKRTTHKA